MTQKQKLAAAVISGAAGEEAVKAAAKAAGVSVETVCGWLAQGEFQERCRALIDRQSDAERAGVWKALVEQCNSGNLAAIKLYFELKDGGTTAAGASKGAVRIIDDLAYSQGK